MACLFRRGNIELKSQAASPSKLYLPLVAGSSGVELKGNCEWRGHALSHSFSPGRLRDRKHSWEIQVVDKPGHGQFPMRELVQQIHVCPMLSWMYVLYTAYSVQNFNQRHRSNTHYSMLLCFHLYRYTLWYLGWKSISCFKVSYLENMGPFIVSFKQVPRIPLGKPVAISYLFGPPGLAEFNWQKPHWASQIGERSVQLNFVADSEYAMCVFDEFAFAALSGCTMGYSKYSKKMGGFLWFSDLSDLLVQSHGYCLKTCDTLSC